MREGGSVGVSVWVVGYLNLCLRDVSLFLLAFRVHNMCFCAQPNFNPFLSKLNSVCVFVCASACLQFSRTDRSANFIFYDNGKNDMIRRGILPTIHMSFLPEC